MISLESVVVVIFGALLLGGLLLFAGAMLGGWMVYRAQRPSDPFFVKPPEVEPEYYDDDEVPPATRGPFRPPGGEEEIDDDEAKGEVSEIVSMQNERFRRQFAAERAIETLTREERKSDAS